MFGESMAAARFQILFKGPRLFFRFERDIGFDFPRFEFCCMRDFACVMSFEPFSQVAGAADVTLIRVIYAAQNISVEHQNNSNLMQWLSVLLRQGFGGHHPSPSLRSGTDGTPSVARRWRAKDGGGYLRSSN